MRKKKRPIVTYKEGRMQIFPIAFQGLPPSAYKQSPLARFVFSDKMEIVAWVSPGQLTNVWCTTCVEKCTVSTWKPCEVRLIARLYAAFVRQTEVTSHSFLIENTCLAWAKRQLKRRRIGHRKQQMGLKYLLGGGQPERLSNTTALHAIQPEPRKTTGKNWLNWP